MPRLPGKEPTQRKFKVGQVLVGSFLMQHEERYWRRVCAIEGCDHRMGPNTSEPGWTDWEPCNTTELPSFVYRKSNIADNVGMSCPCCTGKVLEAEG